MQINNNWVIILVTIWSRWLRIQYQILKILNGGFSMVAWSWEKFTKFIDFSCYYLYRVFWDHWLLIQYQILKIRNSGFNMAAWS